VEAAKSYREENYPYCISNVHTALEIALKDKLKIPPTLSGIRIGPLAGFCMRHKVFPNLTLFLQELIKRANVIDNDHKHMSYEPTPAEALQALNLGEKFIFEIENIIPILSENFLEELSKDLKFLKS
ncbi:MAG: hypothetical protein Q8L29_02375, partial [archaeon]|nr:hypothetical protein [archaeon]